MRKLLKFVLIGELTVCCVLFGMLIADKQTLHDSVIRLHVVANSDSPADQSLKLQVRDAVITALQEVNPSFRSAAEAEDFLTSNLDTIEGAANAALADAGSSDTAVVSLQHEEFPVRHYDTFALPSGVYKSLRITIGEGEGKNWWCVVFPSFCFGATSRNITDTAAGAGFSDGLTNTLTQDKGYEVSFFFLDCIGKLENLFHFE